MPRGLKPIADYAHSKGLLFGLWMEPESLGSHTALYKEHPEFLVTRDGKPAYGRRGLDLAESTNVARGVTADAHQPSHALTSHPPACSRSGLPGLPGTVVSAPNSIPSGGIIRN